MKYFDQIKARAAGDDKIVTFYSQQVMAEHFTLIDELMNKLDRPDPSIDRLWVKEAKLRLAEHRAGRVRGISASDVVGEL